MRDPLSFVQRVLDLKSKYNRILKQSFRDDKKMQKRLIDAFDDFMNKDPRCSLYLALFIDDLLRNGLKGKSETETEIQLDSTILIFRHIRDKDMFEAHHRQLFAKR